MYVRVNVVYVCIVRMCLFVLCLRDIWLLKNHFVWSLSANGNSWHSGKVVFQLVYSIMISIQKLFGRVVSLFLTLSEFRERKLWIHPWIQCLYRWQSYFVITQVHTLHKTYSINTTTNEMKKIGMRQQMTLAAAKGNVLKFGHTIRNAVCAFRHWQDACRTPIHSKCKHFHYESSSSSPSVSPLSSKLNLIIHSCCFGYAYLLDVMNILKIYIKCRHGESECNERDIAAEQHFLVANQPTSIY